MTTPRELTIHSALTRPILLGGADRELVLINLTLIMALIFGVGVHWLSISLAVFLATIGHWGLRRLAHFDPQVRGLYIRHIRYREIYPATSSVYSPSQFVKPTLIN